MRHAAVYRPIIVDGVDLLAAPLRRRRGLAFGRNRPGAQALAGSMLKSALALLLLTGSVVVGLSCTANTGPAGRKYFALRIPVDRDAPQRGDAELRAECGAPFDPAKPTVIVVADGQQFFLRPGAMEELQQEIFSAELNVVGLIGRGDSEACQRAALRVDGSVDWSAAWQVFQASEWIEDLEALRRTLVGTHGSILLYGRSGGAYLAHQYLERYGTRVQRVATQAVVSPSLTRELGLVEDRFWEEVGAIDPSLQLSLLKAMPRDAVRRESLIVTLQRQNFFVPPAQLVGERRRLIEAIARGDEAALSNAREAYQVNEVQQLCDSPRGIAIRVRLYEFVAAAGIDTMLRTNRVDPNLENQINDAQPLLALAKQGKLEKPRWDRSRLHRLDTEVLIGAGVLDHTVDYRGSIALAYSYPRSHLVLLDDDHQLHLANADGGWNRLVTAFLVDGPGSQRFRVALERLDPHRWSSRAADPE